MKGHFYKPHCKCPGLKKKKCKCGAKWSFVLDLGKKPDGSRNQKKKGGFDTLDDAEAAAAIILAKFKKGTYVPDVNIKYGEFKDLWMKNYIDVKKPKVETLRIRKYEINKLMKYFQHTQMKEITGKMFQDALIDLHKNGKERVVNGVATYSGLGRTTLEGIRTTAGMIFEWAKKLKVIKEDPTEDSVIPKDNSTVEDLENKEEEFSYLEKEELSIFLNTARTKGMDRDFVMFMILAYTGMRVGEMCALKWRDVNFKEQRISITKTINNPSNNTKKFELGTPKTIGSTRIIEIDDDLTKALEDHKSLQNEFKQLHKKKYHDQDFVIAKMNVDYDNMGYPERTTFVGYRTTRLMNLTNIGKKITPHKFRHTHVSLLAELGISLEEIMERLGHDDDDTTKKVYLHVTKSRKKEAPRKFSDMMRSLQIQQDVTQMLP